MNIFVLDTDTAIAASIEIRNLTVPQKYQKYYRQKHASWALDKGRGMSYKNRPVPPFMADLIS